MNTTTSTKTVSKIFVADGSPWATGIVASTMGTAPRSPAHERNTCSRHGIRQGAVHSSTESGLATSVRPSPTAAAGNSASGSREGLASSPSRTNRPIWASQPRPSAKPAVARR